MTLITLPFSQSFDVIILAVALLGLGAWNKQPLLNAISRGSATRSLLFQSWTQVALHKSDPDLSNFPGRTFLLSFITKFTFL